MLNSSDRQRRDLAANLEDLSVRCKDSTAKLKALGLKPKDAAAKLKDSSPKLKSSGSKRKDAAAKSRASGSKCKGLSAKRQPALQELESSKRLCPINLAIQSHCLLYRHTMRQLMHYLLYGQTIWQEHALPAVRARHSAENLSNHQRSMTESHAPTFHQYCSIGCTTCRTGAPFSRRTIKSAEIYDRMLRPCHDSLAEQMLKARSILRLQSVSI